MKVHEGFSLANFCFTNKEWTYEELQNASKAMKAAGHLGYEEFCEQLDKTIFTAYCKDANNNLITISGPYNCKEELEKQLQVYYSHLKVITVLSEEDIAFIREALE